MINGGRSAATRGRGGGIPVLGGAAAVRVLLAGVVVLLAAISYFPFRWDPPRLVRNQVVRTAVDTLRFGEMNAARTPGTPAWLGEARTSGSIQIGMEVNPQSSQQDASMMMLIGNGWQVLWCYCSSVPSERKRHPPPRFIMLPASWR